jgi:hypothetical protein
LSVAESEVVPHLVDHREAHLAHHVLARTTDRLNIVLVDDDDFRQLVRGERRLLELGRPVVKAEDVSAQFGRDLAGRTRLDEHGDVAEARGERRGQPLERLGDEPFKCGAPHERSPPAASYACSARC